MAPNVSINAIPADEENNITVANGEIEMDKVKGEQETTAPLDFPTRMDIFYDLNGSLGFAVGSSGFILSMYFSDWLPYFRYGSLTWIWGCVMYSIPLLLKFKGRSLSNDGCPWGIGDLGEFLCYLFYTIGCVLGGFFDAETVEKFLPAINHMFVYGSFSLALEPAYQVWLFVRRGGSCASRARATKLCGGSDPSSSSSLRAHNWDDNSTAEDDDNSNNDTVTAPVSLPPLKLNWDRFVELNAMIFFCAAGYFGGFPPHPSMALPGVYFWEVGSLFSVARSVLMMHRRKQGLDALRDSNKLNTI